MSMSKINEKKMANDSRLLIVGMVVAMVIVWLTLNSPSEEERNFSRICYTACKEIINEQFSDAEASIGLRTKLLIELRECMQECRKEKNEDSDKILGL